MSSDFVKYVQHLKKKHKVTQKNIAEKLGIKESAISQAMKGTKGYRGDKFVEDLKEYISELEEKERQEQKKLKEQKRDKSLSSENTPQVIVYPEKQTRALLPRDMVGRVTSISEVEVKEVALLEEKSSPNFYAQVHEIMSKEREYYHKKGNILPSNNKVKEHKSIQQGRCEWCDKFGKILQCMLEGDSRIYSSCKRCINKKVKSGKIVFSDDL